MHWGFENGNHQYGLNLRATVNDPQGLSNIASVVAVGPDGETEYVLHDDGQHCDEGPDDGIFSYAYECGGDATEPYDLGEYTFTVTDEDGNSSSKTDTLTRFLDLPVNPSPWGFVDTLTPTFSWDPVSDAVEYNIAVDLPSAGEFIWGRGGIGTSSVVYNDDGAGPALAPNTAYAWGVGASDSDGNTSWHHAEMEFIYSDGRPVFAESPYAGSSHYGDENGDDHWLALIVRIDDPEGAWKTYRRS